MSLKKKTREVVSLLLLNSSLALLHFSMGLLSLMMLRCQSLVFTVNNQNQEPKEAEKATHNPCALQVQGELSFTDPSGKDADWAISHADPPRCPVKHGTGMHP